MIPCWIKSNQSRSLLAVNKSEYLLHYTIQVTVTVPSSRSLEPVALPANHGR